jgi:DNA polymerase elongation subunit (family B)
MKYLIAAEPIPEGIKLLLWNQRTQHQEVNIDRQYRPYFYIPHPIPRPDRTLLQELEVEVSTVIKRDFFTGHPITVTKVEHSFSDSSIKTPPPFTHIWEREVPPALSYVYDHGLTFGSEYTPSNTHVHSNPQLPDTVQHRFDERFTEVKTSDPEKYAVLSRWFTLCAQSVPEFPSVILGTPQLATPDQQYHAIMLARVANIPVPQAATSRQVSIWIRSILHQFLRDNNILIPTSAELRRDEIPRRIQGALTFPPKAGVYFNTVVTDFESLYPSLIDAYNLSHETINCPYPDHNHTPVPGLRHYVCHQRRGIYALLIGALKDLRIYWYKPLARDQTLPLVDQRRVKAMSQLLKMLLVSSYGVTIRIHGLSHPSLAEAITAYGRFSLQTAWDLAINQGLQPLYGDTDSLFLNNPRESQVKKLISSIKQQLHLDLAVEARYSLCILPQTMKTYIGIRQDGSVDIKGVSAIKSNAPLFIQQVFKACINALANVHHCEDLNQHKPRLQKIVHDAIQKLKAGQIPLADLEYRVTLHEDPLDKLEDPVVHQPYQCAIQLIDAGQNVQKRETVAFVKVYPFPYRNRTFTVKPTQHVNSITEVNVEEYIRNLQTALNQIFKPMTLQFTRVRTSNVSLSDFM